MMKIIKADGEETIYKREKVVQSLERAGIGQEVIQRVVSETEKELFDGIHTKALYKILFKNLKKWEPGGAGKYHLKRAIMELGPTGFPFEKFIATLLEAEGYHTLTDQLVQGRCVEHEVDVIAEKEGRHFMVECKFHSVAGNVCNVRHALYVYARFLDVEQAWVDKLGYSKKSCTGWLVTNTKLTSDAEKYGKCVGLGLLSWNYPPEDSLKERIDRVGLYPITCITSLSKREKQLLLDKNIVLCRSLCKHPSELNGVCLSETKKRRVLEEAGHICKTEASGGLG